MRAYWAVIVDSFRESLHSKVLWTVMGLITLLLMILAPLGIDFSAATHLHPNEIGEPIAFAREVYGGADDEPSSPRRIVWQRLDSNVQEALRKFVRDDSPSVVETFATQEMLIESLNDLINGDALFDAEQMQSLSPSPEAVDLQSIRPDQRTPQQQQRLNRLTLASVYPRFITGPAQESATIAYLGFQVSEPLPFGRYRMRIGLKYVLIGFMDLIAAPLGIFTAILVTASIIPNMFDAGSVNLLFSKPIHRWLLYLSKFAGGCWFVLICATYLITGIWGLIGLRLGIWHPTLLYVIPVLTFLFAVYYSVSALAGIIWRNSIMCIVSAIVFWAVCLLLGVIHGMVESFVVLPNRIVHMLEADGDLLMVNDSSETFLWNAGEADWEQVFERDMSQSAGGPFDQVGRLLGPVYDAPGKRIVAVGGRMSGLRILEGFQDRQWRRSRIDAAPSGTFALLVEPPSGEADDSGLLLIDPDRISRLAQKQGPGNKTFNLFGKGFTIGPKRGSMKPVGPPAYQHTHKATGAVINQENGSLYLYAPGMIHRLTAEGEQRQYVVAAERAIHDDKTQALIASAGKFLLVASEDGPIELLDATTLESRHTFKKSSIQVPRFARASDDGRYFAVVFHDGTAWFYDAQSEEDLSRRLPGQSHITGLSFDSQGQLLLASDPPCVKVIDPATQKVLASHVGSYPLLNRIHYHVIRPLYRVFPQPGKLKETANYLLLDKATVSQGPDRSLSGPRAQIQPWKPVWNSCIFMACMLAAGCIYIQRQEL